MTKQKMFDITSQEIIQILNKRIMTTNKILVKDK